MCGISGSFDPRGGVRREDLLRMARAQAHRGPDGEGAWIAPDARLGFSHVRLSIVDLTADAAQPMSTADGAATLCFNGEIYNHAELRLELEAAGVRFVTDHSDTEVLLHALRHWGVDAALERLNGMFAFAYTERAAHRLWLVRDRLGIKPLYHAALPGGGLAFASEAKALFTHPALDARLDHRSFRHYLSFRAVPAPATLFEGVEQLGAGELLELNLADGSTRRRRWWDVLDNAATPPPTEAAAHDRLEELLASSVDLRSLADVPVGLFLSGGVDSAYLLECLAERRSRPSTFTLTYPGQAYYDEGSAALSRARSARAIHHEVALGPEDYADALARVAWHQDEPIAAPVCTSVYALSRAARSESVPVILAGEGADELFVGYSNWIRLRDAERWNRRVPDVPGRMLRRGARAACSPFLSWLAPEREVLRRAASGEPLFQGGALDFGESAKSRLIGPAVGAGDADTYAEVIAPLRADFLARRDADDLTAWMSYVDLRFRLPQLMLPRLDKMGMAFGVEGRVPFLDHRVAEVTFGLPAAWRGGVGKEPKALFKRVAERKLPRAFVRARKRGFQAPVKEWKLGSFGQRALPALTAFADRTGLFETRALASLLAEGGDRLWFSLFNFVLWHGLYLENPVSDLLPELDDLRPRTHAAA
ncbi:MAG: asparagine synthase (glutamine-hydrolyzing) [Planctomycetes bacterium]|nr:asparagine synthase (glutamine-hydrolyzing) [Planctomycetota bacterium]